MARVAVFVRAHAALKSRLAAAFFNRVAPAEWRATGRVDQPRDARTWTISAVITDLVTAAIAVVTPTVLLRWKVREPYLVAAGAVAGIALHRPWQR